MWFQEPCSTGMESIRNYNLYLLMVIVCIIIGIAWLMRFCLNTSFEFISSTKKSFVHSSLLESIWTTGPGILLINLISPSLILLYLLEENSNPLFTIKILGHQWYWTCVLIKNYGNYLKKNNPVGGCEWKIKKKNFPQMNILYQHRVKVTRNCSMNSLACDYINIVDCAGEFLHRHSKKLVR